MTARWLWLAGAMLATPAHAAQVDYGAIRAELTALKAEAERTQARIAALEAAIAAASPSPQGAAPPVAAVQAPSAPNAPSGPSAPSAPFASGRVLAQNLPAAPVNPAGGSGPGAAPPPRAGGLTVNGDLRVRYEANRGDANARNRDRVVMRGRLRAAYPVTRWLTIGGQLATGDPNDPNSTDITLSGFDNDLDVSLDQAFIRLNFGDTLVSLGKLPQPLVRTELVWDGDVSPEGAGITQRLRLSPSTTLRAHGLYFLVDEAPAGRDSSMIGGQLALESRPVPTVAAELALGYYDYRLASLAGGDAGDFRTNRIIDGRYLSDFNLLDVVGAATWSGLGERWPIRIVGDFVHNFGARDANTGFGVDLLAGRITRTRDWRVAYGYAQTEVDAVLAAFSHDNTSIATNYAQHMLSADYVAANNILLNLTYYRFKPLSARFAGANDPRDWLDRFRLNLLVQF